MAAIELRGVVLDDTGAAVNGATVELYDVDTTTPVRATTTTNSSGQWAISHSTRGRFDVKITNGSDIVWLRGRDRFQTSTMTINENATNQEALIVTRSEDAASLEVAIFEGDRATPADGDTAYISLRHSDDAGNQDEQARISWSATTVADGATQDGDVFLSALTNGTLTEYLRIDGSAGDLVLTNVNKVFIGDSANANMTVGLTINQGANDNQIFAGKSSDVVTGLSSATGTPVETDDFITIVKSSATAGGVRIQALAEDGAVNQVFQVHAYGGQANTVKTTSAQALIEFLAAEHDGANALADITADGNVFAIRARVGGAHVARFLVDEDGDLYSVTTAQTFDAFDDFAILETLEKARSGDLSEKVRADFGEVMEMDEQTLLDMKVLGAPVADGGFTNQTQLIRVLTGALRQLEGRVKALEGA